MVLGGFIFIGPRVLALTQTDYQDATYTIVLKGTITVFIKSSNQTYTFTDDNIKDDIYNWKPTAGAIGTPCMVDSHKGPNDGVNATSNLINPPGARGGSVVNVGEVLGIGPRGPNCGNLVSVNDIILLNPNNISFGGTGDNGGVDNATGSDDACYQSGWALSWVACPVITAAQTSANAMYGFVEDQLKFRVPADLGGNKCPDGSFKIRCNGVYKTWDEFRILVSALVVVLMLVMVISQAIGGGPFDAYTVKKMLPRLVIGVVLIQLSWPIFSWIVNAVDDLGVGLADLMYAPFGGANALNLNSVMGPFVKEGAVFSWVGIPALVVFGVVAPFIVLGMSLTVLVAIFAGFLALLFRKILITLCLIFVPLALIAWIVPGTERYWKLWQDNFIKTLMMFPLIIAMIAAGRIFAKVGSGQGGDFVGFFIVLVGFFGPLFILPKTFKWGGNVMQLAGNALTKTQERALKKPKEFLGERQKGWSAERTRQSEERFSKDEGFNLRRPWRRPIDLVKSGRMDPTLWGRRRQQAMDTYVSRGVASEAEDLKAASDRQRREEEQINEGATADPVTGRALNKDDFWQDVAMGVDREYQTYDGRTIRTGGRSATERRAARDRLSVLGGATNFRAIEQMYEATMNGGGAEDQAEMRKFLNDNVQTLLPKMTHLYKGIMSSADASPENIAEMHGVEVESILSGLSARIADTTRPVAERRAAQRSLGTFLRNYQAAARNVNLRGRMELGGTRAVKAFLSADRTVGDYQLRRINMDPRDGRARRTYTRIDPATGATVTESLPVLIDASASPDVIAAIDPATRTYLDTHIQDEGGFS